MVYLPMAYIYGHRVTAPLSPLITQLRREIYSDSAAYDDVVFEQQRDSIAHTDMYHPTSTLLHLTNKLTHVYEKYIRPSFLRTRALSFILSYIRAEDAQTQSIDIGPVNKFINMLCIYHADGAASSAFTQHVQRVDDYLYMSEDGLKVQGYNGSQLWDTAFAAQAYAEAYACVASVTMQRGVRESMQRMYTYIDGSQVREDVEEKEKWFRHSSVGGW